MTRTVLNAHSTVPLAPYGPLSVVPFDLADVQRANASDRVPCWRVEVLD